MEENATTYLESFLAKYDDLDETSTPVTVTPTPHKPNLSRSRYDLPSKSSSSSSTTTAFIIDSRLVQLWGSSRGKHRSELARSLCTLLTREGDQALDGKGCFVSSMLLFKRCSAVVRVTNIKLETDNTTTTTTTKAENTAVDERNLSDSLSVMTNLLRLPRHGVEFAQEFVATNLTLQRMLRLSPTIADSCVNILSVVYSKTSFVDLFKNGAQLSSYADSIGDIEKGNSILILLRLLVDNGNTNGIPDTEGLGKRSIAEIHKLMFHRLPRVRSAVSSVIVSDLMNMPIHQQVSRTEMIRAGLLILRSHTFEREQIVSGFSMLMAVLRRGENTKEEDDMTVTVEIEQIRDGVMSMLNNPKTPEGRTMFESRDYEKDMLRSSQEAALKILKYIATTPHGHLLDHKVVVREVLGSMTNKQDYVVQVEALETLRVYLERRDIFPVSVCFLTLLMGDTLFKKMNSLHKFILRSKSKLSSTSTVSTSGAASTASTTATQLTATKKKRGKKNWMKAISSTTTSVESIGGTKIVSAEASMRHFLTTDLDAETIVGLHLALRQVGWMDQSQVGGPSVDATTSSLLIGNKLRGKMLRNRSRKKREKEKKEREKNGILQFGNGRYHDEGVIHLPSDTTNHSVSGDGSVFNGRSGSSGSGGRTKKKRSLAAKLGAGGQIRTRLKMALPKKKKKSVSSLLASLKGRSDDDWNFSTMSAPVPVAVQETVHLKYRPLGFASFGEGMLSKKESDASGDDILESVTKDE